MEIKIDKEELSKAALRRKRYLRNSMLAAPLVGASLCAAAEYKRDSTIEYKREISTPEIPQVRFYSDMFPFFAFYTIAAYLVLDGMKKFGGFSVDNALKYNFYVFKYGFNRIIKNDKKAHLSDKEFSRYIKDPLDKQLVLAGIDVREGKIDLAFERYDAVSNALRTENLPVSLVDRLSSWIGNGLAYLFEKKDASYFISKALGEFRRGKINKTKENLTKAVEVENSAETNLLYAYFLDLMRDRKKGEQFARTASIIRSDPTTEFEPIDETKNEVCIVSGEKYISKAFVVKRNEDKQHLEGERDLIERIRDEIEQDKRMHLPVPVGDIILNEGKHECYFRREKHERLDYRIKKQHPLLEKNFEDISDFLVAIYCAVPIDTLQEEEDIPVIANRLRRVGVNLDTIFEITENLNPAISACKNSVLVYKKDPHILNWGVLPDESIIAFDFEPAPAIRLEKDLPNLTDTDGISEDLKDRVHKRVVEGYNSKNKYGLKIDLYNSRLAFYNGVLLRAFKMYGPLTRMKEREEMKKDVLRNASLASDKLAEKFPDYFFHRDNKASYQRLRVALTKLV